MKTIYLNVLDENKKNDILLVCQRLGVKVENIGSYSLNKTLLNIFAGNKVNNLIHRAVKKHRHYIIYPSL